MILPSKHLPIDRSLLGVGAELLERLDVPRTVSGLWTVIQERRRDRAGRLPFDWFVLALNLLFTLGVIELERGQLVKRQRND